MSCPGVLRLLRFGPLEKARDAVAEDTDPLLIEMNARHALLTHEAGAARISEFAYELLTLAKNRLHLIMTSNEDWVVPAGIDERRFAVFRPSSHRQGPEHKPYFDALGAQMDAGGLAAMLYDLREMDLSGFNPRQMPESRELSQQKLESLTGPNRVVMEMLMEGIAPGGFYPSVKVGNDRHQRADPAVRVPALISWAIDRRMLREAPSSQKMGAALKLLGIERDKFSDNGKEVCPCPRGASAGPSTCRCHARCWPASPGRGGRAGWSTP